jgi:tetratricopeptide (TPR) repeat protein
MTSPPTTSLGEVRAALASGPRDLPALGPTLDAALAREPSRADLHLARGLLLLYRDQEFEAACTAFSRARDLATDPELRAEARLEEARALELLGRDAEARAAAGAALAGFPEGSLRHGKAAFLLARLEAARRELDLALAAHRRARPYYESSEGPGLAEYHGFLAWLAERRHDPRAWVRAVRDLTAIDPRALAVRRMAAAGRTPRKRVRRLLRLLRRLEKALDMAEQGGWADAEARVDLVSTFTFEGLLLHLLDRPKSALRKLRRAIARDPRDGLAHHVAGRCLLARRKPIAASAKLARAAELAPHADVLLDLARAQERAHDLEGARATLERLVALDPGAQAFARLGRAAQALDRKEEALAAYLEATRKDERRGRALAAKIGLLLTELGRDEDARVWLDRALRVQGGDPELLVARAHCLSRIGRPRPAYRDLALAVEALETARATNPGLVPLLAHARYLSGDVLARLGRPAQAMAELDLCLQLAPERDDALLLKGDCARALGRHKEAIDLWKEVIDRKLGDKLLKDGVALYEEGKYVDALRKYREAFERFPKGWEVFYRTAQAYARLGESAPALKYLAIALKINRNVRMLLEKDPAVARFRGTPELREILGESPPASGASEARADAEGE